MRNRWVGFVFKHLPRNGIYHAPWLCADLILGETGLFSPSVGILFRYSCENVTDWLHSHLCLLCAQCLFDFSPTMLVCLREQSSLSKIHALNCNKDVTCTLPINYWFLKQNCNCFFVLFKHLSHIAVFNFSVTLCMLNRTSIKTFC